MAAPTKRKKTRELTPLERLADLTRRIVAVPKEEVEKLAARRPAKRKRRRG
jgi:hypothetical protein